MSSRLSLPEDAVDAAASTAHAQVTYANISPGDPYYPFPEGGFWGRFMESLEARWEHVNRKATEGPYDGFHRFHGENCTECGAEETVMYRGEQWCTNCIPIGTKTSEKAQSPDAGQKGLGDFAVSQVGDER